MPNNVSLLDRGPTTADLNGRVAELMMIRKTAKPSGFSCFLPPDFYLL